MSDQIKEFRAISANELKPLTVTVATTRKISGLGNTTIWALIKQGKLEVVRIGRRTLITFRSLEALLVPSQRAEDKIQEQKNGH